MQSHSAATPPGERRTVLLFTSCDAYSCPLGVTGGGCPQYDNVRCCKVPADCEAHPPLLHVPGREGQARRAQHRELQSKAVERSGGETFIGVVRERHSSPLEAPYPFDCEFAPSVRTVSSTRKNQRTTHLCVTGTCTLLTQACLLHYGISKQFRWLVFTSRMRSSGET